MNSLSIIIGSILLVVSLTITIIGGWEKFRLQKKDEGWLAMFIVGLVGIFASIGLILLGAFTNRPKKININNFLMKP